MDRAIQAISKFFEAIVSNPGLVSALVAIAGVIFTWRKFREESLRRGEVLAWADDCIRIFENLIVAAILVDRSDFEEECRKRVLEAAFDAPALVERGRIFFKNQPHGSYGSQKPPAYRGLRPKILDPLVAAHQIAVRFVSSDGEERIRLQLLAEDYLRTFVSLVQKEIGRERTAAAETKQAGRGFDLKAAMDAISSKRVDHVRQARAGKLNEYRTRIGPEPEEGPV
jgi:hypothetical protein